MKLPRRYRATYAVMRFFFRPYLALKYKYRPKPCVPKSEPYLLMTNHTTALDQYFSSVSFPKFMYFVAGEYLFRLGWLSKLVVFLINPISRKKGSGSEDTVERIKDELGRGVNVCIAVEGYCTMNGETGWISESAGRLARESGAGLVLYNLYGGFFVNPRWGVKKRKGPVWGEFIREYTAGELAEMTDREVTEAIRQGLYVNAYEVQRKAMHRYSGKNMAERLEFTLYVCPVCRRLGTLTSSGDFLTCACGMRLKYNEYGFFEAASDAALVYDNILEWDLWQRVYVRDILDTYRSSGLVIAEKDNAILTQISESHKESVLGHGAVRMYHDRLEFDGGGRQWVYRLDEIRHFAVAQQRRILFSTDGGYFEIKSSDIYCARLFFVLYRYLLGKDYI